MISVANIFQPENLEHPASFVFFFKAQFIPSSCLFLLVLLLTNERNGVGDSELEDNFITLGLSPILTLLSAKAVDSI
jgi:hypothetical protein